MRLMFEVPDPPAGWQYTGEYRQPAMNEPYEVDGEAVISEGECGQYLILRRREPVRESRWVNVYRETSYETLEKSNVGSGSHRQGVIRLDYENNKLVAVTLEPLGEGGGE